MENTELRMSPRLISLALVPLLSSFVWSHPGHGETDAGHPAHYLLSIEHVSVLLAIGVLGGFLVLGGRTVVRKWKSNRIHRR